MNHIPDDALNLIASSIERYFCLPSKRLPPLALPTCARDESRCQYNAAKILTGLEPRLPEYCCKTIAVTYEDLFIPIFTHVMGEARIGGDIAVISLFRLTENSAGSSSAPSVIFTRAVKLALHELGHLFALPHCPDARCMMHFSGTAEELDSMDLNFCTYCSTFIDDALKANFR